MEGFVFRMCSQNPEKVLDLMRAFTPRQVTVEQRPKRYRSVEEVHQELARYGIHITQPALPNYKGPEIELDGEEITDPAAPTWTCSASLRVQTFSWRSRTCRSISPVGPATPR
jgi:hypothetical protein